MRLSSSFAAVGLVLGMLASVPASAVVVTSRVGLAGTDSIDWAQFLVSTSTGAASVTTALGATATVNNVLRLDQGFPPSGYWQANFTPGDALVLSYSDVVVLTFDLPIAGAGTQFATGVRYGAFDATLSAFDGAGNLLEEHTLPGVLSDGFDGSAVFVGLARNQADIKRLEFRVDLQEYNIGYPVINRVDILPTAPVPEPAAALLILAGVPVVVWAQRRRRLAG